MSWGQGDLRSPNRNFLLEGIEGRPDVLESAGAFYSRIGEQMTATANELKKLADSEKYKAVSLDDIRETAGQLQGDLRDAAVRYTGTGPVLVTYAAALRIAQTTGVDPYVDKIRTAHAQHEAAVQARRSAESDVDDLGTTWPWEDDPTDAQRASASSALSNAEQAEGAAGGTLTSLWESFESGYSSWESAYDDAADGIADAIDSSGINDSWWEDFLDGLATFATIVATIAVIAALIIAGPLAGILLLVATVASAIALAAHLTMMLAGSKRVSMTDIFFDALGVVPFLGAFAKGLKGGRTAMVSLRSAAGVGGASRTTITAGRNAVARDLRTIAGAGGHYGGQAGRAARAPGVADDFLSRVQASWGRNTWNALRHGGTQLDGQAYTLSERMVSAWPGGTARLRSTRWMDDIGSGASPILQGLNVWNLGYGGYQSAEGMGAPLPMPDFIPTPGGR